MDTGSPTLPHVRSTSKTVAIHRVSPGERHFIIGLSAKIDGLLTHYIKQRSLWCNPVKCEHCEKGDNAIYKGYIAAKRYCPLERGWIACVQEITEHLEICMRLQYRAGQVWELSRAAPTKKKKFPPVEGRISEDRGEITVPAFDVLPILRTWYHDPHIQLGRNNPLPMPVQLEVTHDAPPTTKAQKEQAENEAVTQEERAKMQAELRKRMQGIGSLNGNNPSR